MWRIQVSNISATLIYAWHWQHPNTTDWTIKDISHLKITRTLKSSSESSNYVQNTRSYLFGYKNDKSSLKTNRHAKLKMTQFVTEFPLRHRKKTASKKLRSIFVGLLASFRGFSLIQAVVVWAFLIENKVAGHLIGFLIIHFSLKSQMYAKYTY